jgi:hypothetical protein
MRIPNGISLVPGYLLRDNVMCDGKSMAPIHKTWPPRQKGYWGATSDRTLLSRCTRSSACHSAACMRTPVQANSTRSPLLDVFGSRYFELFSLCAGGFLVGVSS